MTEKTIIQRFAEMVKEMPDLTYDSKNPHFKNEYLSFQGLMKAIKPTLDKHGFILVQPTRIDSHADVFVLTTMFIHIETGDSYVAAESLIPVYERGQDYGSRLTYTKRYDLIAALGLAPDKDDDNGNESELPKPPTNRRRTLRN